MTRTRVRRRRLSLLVWATMLVLGIATRGAQALGPADAPVNRPVPLEYIVQPGDSLWSIAVGVADGRDPRVVVDAIQRANGLGGGAIVPGQLLRLPIHG